MPSAQTPESLLNRLRERPDDAAAWQRFDTLYRPVLRTWLRRYFLQPQDADDLVQQVLAVVVRELPDFHYDPRKGKFLGWLRAILHNRLREFRRSRQTRPVATGGDEALLNQLVNHRSDPNRVWDREHARHVAQCLLARIEPDFSPTTWQAFRRVMAGEKVAEVAADLKMSVNAVYLAKSAVLKRLRQEVWGIGGIGCRFFSQVFFVSCITHRGFFDRNGQC
jgi:RNA polymerase sigma-70 factor (ECF subfamily)